MYHLEFSVGALAKGGVFILKFFSRSSFDGLLARSVEKLMSFGIN